MALKKAVPYKKQLHEDQFQFEDGSVGNRDDYTGLESGNWKKKNSPMDRKVKRVTAEIDANKAKEESGKANSFKGIASNTIKAIPQTIHDGVKKVVVHYENKMRGVAEARQNRDDRMINENFGNKDNYEKIQQTAKRASQKNALKKAIKPK